MVTDRYPRLVGGATDAGDLTWTVWARKGAGAGEVWRLEWIAPGPTVVVKIMRGRRNAWVNKWDDPASHEVIYRFGAENVRDARQAMMAYAREHLGVVQVSGV